MNSPPSDNSALFRSALRDHDAVLIRRVPKSDLHAHSILATRFGNLERWIGHPLPRPSLPMRSLNEMIAYAQDVLYPHLNSRMGFEFTAQSAIEDAIQDGVTVFEISMDVRFMTYYTPLHDSFFDFVSRLSSSFGDMIDVRPEIGISKDRPPSEHMTLARQCIYSGVFRSIDLYGNDTAQPPDVYQPLYDEARAAGLKLKAHVGEFSGPDLIERTLDILKPDELQHGISAARSLPLMKRLRDHRIRLNVCPSSNVALGIVPRLSEHPIRTLYDHGVRVTINTDDLTIFGSSVSDQYARLYDCGLFSDVELDSIRLEGLSAEPCSF